MTYDPLRRGALAALASAALLGTVLSAPASAVPDDGRGEVVLTVVDSAGQPLKAAVGAVSVDSSSGSGPGNTAASSHNLSLDEGSYGLFGMAPWAGVFCEGVSPCTIYNLGGSGSGVVITEVLKVTDTETPLAHTFKAPAPATVAGGDRVGQSLSVTLSPEMQSLAALTGQYGGLLTQWLRDGVEIPGAASPTYTLTAADVGHQIAPRLSYSPMMQGLWASLGADFAPLVLAGRKAVKSPTLTTVQVFRKSVVAGTSTGFRADVTSGAAPATGKVRVTIGKVKLTKTLRNGSIRGALPKSLKPGTYKIVATYFGDATYEASKGKDKLTVKPAKKPKKR